jgi:hypothetical protein
MIPLCPMTGDAQPAVGHELCDRRFAMAGVTRRVRVDRVTMRSLDIGTGVTARAVPSRAMVIVVAGGTPFDGVSRIQ